MAILFIVLEIVAIYSYAYSTPYTQGQVLSFTSVASGVVRGSLSSVGEYFSLRNENIRLTERIAELENRIDRYSEMLPDEVQVTGDGIHNYEYIAARVVSHTINHRNNYMTLDKGTADNVMEGMSVVSPEGFAVGSVISCSEHYAVAKTMLNAEMYAGARLASDGTSGTVSWDGTDPMVVTMSEVSKYASITEGEAVFTTSNSYVFPPDVMIGTVESFSLDEQQTKYTVQVRLAADMTRLYNVLLVGNNSSGEAKSLEEFVRSSN